MLTKHVDTCNHLQSRQCPTYFNLSIKSMSFLSVIRSWKHSTWCALYLSKIIACPRAAILIFAANSFQNPQEGLPCGSAGVALFLPKNAKTNSCALPMGPKQTEKRSRVKSLEKANQPSLVVHFVC